MQRLLDHRVAVLRVEPDAVDREGLVLQHDGVRPTRAVVRAGVDDRLLAELPDARAVDVPKDEVARIGRIALGKLGRELRQAVPEPQDLRDLPGHVDLAVDQTEL